MPRRRHVAVRQFARQSDLVGRSALGYIPDQVLGDRAEPATKGAVAAPRKAADRFKGTELCFLNQVINIDLVSEPPADPASDPRFETCSVQPDEVVECRPIAGLGPRNENLFAGCHV